MLPQHDWTWLKIVKARLYAAAPAHAPTGPVITSVQLLDLGQQLMDEAKSAGAPISKHDAVIYRDGLMIAFLAFIPIRRKNLAALEIDRHLVRGDSWFVIIPGEENKDGKAHRVPGSRTPRGISSNLSRYRSSTAAPASRLLCALVEFSRWRSRICRDRRHHHRALDEPPWLPHHPHDARDAAATTWALSAPDQIGIARDLLAHSDLRTTIKYYNRARRVEASRAHGHVIAEMRRKQNR